MTMIEPRKTTVTSRRRGPRTARDWTLLALITLFGACFIIPMYVAVSNALKAPSAAQASKMWELPLGIDLTNLAQAFDSLFPNLGNSIIVAIGATIGSALLGSVNGFVLAKWKFRGADVLLLILLFGMFIPYQVILIPMVKALDTIGLYGNLGGLILVHILYGLPLTTLIFRNFYSSIPNELLEAAALDGAGGVRTFRDVILPLSGPGFVVVAIFQFTNIWNDFLFGLVVVPNPKYQPITVALNNLSGALAVDWGVVMAGAVLASLPTGIVYLLLGRFFVSGLMAGSIK